MIFLVEMLVKCSVLNKQKQQENKKSRAGFQSQKPEQEEEINSLNDVPFAQFPKVGLVKSNLKTHSSSLRPFLAPALTPLILKFLQIN